MPTTTTTQTAVAAPKFGIVGTPPLVHTAECAAQHFAPWMIEERWFRSAVDAVRNGTLQPKAFRDGEECDDEPPPPYRVYSGVAVIPMAGPIMKARSKYGGCSSVDTRRAIRKAVNDEEVRSILLHIDSPGGTVAGTADLAADVREANARKPVYAHIDDLGASAAYWVASQARRITANATAEVGSIGTLLVLADTSGAYAANGIKVHVISTGKYKGAGADGAPVTDDHLAMFQQEVDDLNEHFLKGVSQGRGMSISKVRAIADGRVHIAEKAKGLGLIDAVVSLDAAFEFISAELPEEAEDPCDPVLPESTQAEQAPEVSQANVASDPPPAVPPPENPMAEQATASTVIAPAQTPAAGTENANTQGTPPNPNPTLPPPRTELESLRNATQQARDEAAEKRGFKNATEAADKRLRAIAAACPGQPQMAIDAFLSGQTPEAVRLAHEAAERVRIEAQRDADEKAQEIFRLKAKLEIGGYADGVEMSFTDADASSRDEIADPKAYAEREWDAKPSVRKGFSGKANYVAARVRELNGTVQRQTASA